MPSVLVTGASRGIGRAIVIELADRGHRVIATARNVENLSDLDVDQALPLDVTDQASVDAAIALAGEVDVLVSNAGETWRSPVESVPLTEVERLFRLNTLGALRVTQAVVPSMRRRRSGRLVYVSSIVGRVPVPMLSAYAASKWALEAIAETLAIEVAGFGIAVSILEPGAVATTSSATAAPAVADDDPYRELLRSLAALRERPIPAGDVARAVADAVIEPNPRLRIPVGESARAVIARRDALPYDQLFSATTGV